MADIPAGAGMGSSSTFTVGVIHNLLTRVGGLKEITKFKLAELACKIEISDMNQPIGKQDQFAASFGGFNIFKFHEDDTVSVEPVNIKDCYGWLKYLRLYHIGNHRSATKILKIQNSESSKPFKQKILSEMVSLVDPFSKALTNGEWVNAGKIMHENWLLKQKLTSSISSLSIDEAYSKAIKAGAIGGKLLGAGGGGFLLFVVPPEYHQNLDKSLSEFGLLNFNWDFHGSTIQYTDEIINF